MYAVGVDVSNGWSTVVVLRSKTDVVIRPFNVTHNSQGFASLLEKSGTLDGEIKVVMEHTGNYYESIANVLHESGLCPLPILKDRKVVVIMERTGGKKDGK